MKEVSGDQSSSGMYFGDRFDSAIQNRRRGDVGSVEFIRLADASAESKA